jgi:phage regulator Rha-like protein
MNDIILSMRNGKPVVSSRQIAENFDKNHRDVLRAVDNLKEDVRNFAQMFFESTEPEAQVETCNGGGRVPERSQQGALDGEVHQPVL